MSTAVKWLSKLNSRISDGWWLAGGLFVSAAVQLSFITKSDIWHDEGFSIMLAPHSIANLIARDARDVHPPLYYIVLHFWMLLFGSSELAVRSLSTVAILGTIIIMFFLIRKLFGEGSARSSVLLMALAPFLIRYGQETRMYALVAFLLALASYTLVKALDKNSTQLLYLYGVIMAAALYTHYYAVFMIIVHWLYVLSRTFFTKAKAKRFGLKNIHWWGANALMAVLFLPWLPTAYRQFRHVQSGFWIPPVKLATIPATVGQFLHFTSLSGSPLVVRLGILGLILGLSLAAYIMEPAQRYSLLLLVSWAFLAEVAVFMISIVSRSVYQDRYFVFASVAFYPLLACLFYLKPLNYLHKIRPLLIAGLCFLLILGIHDVYLQSNHQMKAVGNYVNDHYQPGDQIITGEIYVYFDYSYFNHTGLTAKLYAPGGVNGYNESSLIYDIPGVIVKNYANLQPTSGNVWLIGKPGVHSYYNQVPSNWRLVAQFQTKDAVADKFAVGPLTLSAAE